MKTLLDERHLDTQESENSPGLPMRPRFLRELVTAPTAEGLVVDGAAQLHVLWGEAAKSVIPALIPLMDGIRTISEIAAELPQRSVQEVRDSISSLSGWGLVEEGPERIGDFNDNPESVSFFRRYAGGFAAGTGGDGAYERLRDVVIVGWDENQEVTRYLSSLLTSTGFRGVSCVDWESFRSAQGCSRDGATKPFIVALSMGDENCERLAEVDDHCSAAGVSWLRIAVDRDRNFADVGPVFDRSTSPCYGCFARIHSAPEPRPETDRLGSVDPRLWICLAAAQVTYLLSQVGAPNPEGWFRRYQLGDWTSQHLCYAAIPGCRWCRTLPADQAQQDRPMSVQSEPVDVAVLFEDYMARRAAPLQSGATVTDAHALLELTKQTKRMLNCPQHNLPATLPDLGVSALNISSEEATSGKALGASELGSLLMLTAGVRRLARNTGTLKRWAATAGNLGSVELFAVVRSVEGLAPGYYFYQPQENTLASVRRHSGGLSVEDFMSRVIARDGSGLPDALILFTGAYHRVSSKYGAFAYRLINLDAGAALSQLKMIAAAMNISSRVENRWADDLMEDQLALDPMAEQSTAVVSLWSGCRSRRDLESTGSEARRGTPRSAKAAREYCEVSVLDVARMVYRESRMTEAEVLLTPFALPETFPKADDERGQGIPLPPPAKGGAGLGDILRRRGSMRRYRNDPVSLDQISTMLCFAQRADVSEWPEENLHQLGLRFTILAQRVESLDPGFYEYDSSRRSLICLRGPLSREELAQLYVQEEFAGAPLVIWITGHLGAACARHGAFGHRQLLLRAGAAGNRLWTAASGLGLGGTLIAGMKADAARRVLGLEGYLRSGLLAVAIGYPRQHNAHEHSQ